MNRKTIMKTKTELEERLESTQRDVGLILADVRRGQAENDIVNRVRELKSAVHGMETVLNDLSELRDATQQAIESYERVWAQLGHAVK